MDARRKDRIRLIYHLRVFDTRTGKPLGVLVDLTPEGMMLMADQQLPTGYSSTLHMDLPANVMDGGRLSFQGEVVWCREDAEDGFYSLGIAMRELSDSSISVVRELIDRFHRPESVDEELEAKDPFAQQEQPDITD